MTLRIEVQGTSTISRRPERAVVHLHVSSTGQSLERVMDDVTSTSNQLQHLLKSKLAPKASTGEPEADSAVTHWTMSSLSTGSWYVYDHEGNPKERTYSASTRFEMKFQDFAKLGVVATDLASMPHVTIQRIDWRLTDVTRAGFGSRSRKEAVEDAFAKARDYAEAVGLTEVTAVEIVDSQGPMVSGSPMFGRVHRGAVTRGGGAPREELSFEPENVDVVASVKVVFEAK